MNKPHYRDVIIHQPLMKRMPKQILDDLVVAPSKGTVITSVKDANWVNRSSLEDGRKLQLPRRLIMPH